MNLSELHTRQIPLDFELREADGGLTATGLVVPYNRETRIVEVRDGQPVEYFEGFTTGSCERAVRAPFRVGFYFGHSDSFDNRIGYATALHDSAEGLIGDFRIDRSREGHVRDVLSSSHSGLSMAFVSILPKPGAAERNGAHVLRRAVHVVHVAAVEEPAYQDARVLELINRGVELDQEPTTNEIDYAAMQATQRDLLDWVSVARSQQQGYSQP